MNEADKKRIGEIRDEIVESIGSIALNVVDVKLTDGNNLRRSASEIEEEVYRNLHILFAKASLGDSNSIVSLRNIGVASAGHLEEVNLPAGEQQRKIDSFPPQHQTPAMIISCKAQDTTSIDQIIQREDAFIRSLEPEEIFNAFEASVDYDYNVYFSCTNILFEDPLTTPVSPKNTNRQSETLVDQAQGAASAFDEVQARLKARGAEEIRATRSMTKFRDMVNGLIRTSFLRNLRQNAQASLQTVAANSLSWPVVAHCWGALISGLPGKIRQLNLGSTWPFRVAENPGGGRPRDFGLESSTLFVLSLCSQVSEQKLLFPRPTETEKAALSEADKILRTSSMENAGSIETTLGGKEIRWTQESHWRVKALLVPDFNICREPGQAGSNAKQLWKEALLALAGKICQGDWENYPWWPQPVYQRGRHDRKAVRLRKKSEAVEELIVKGFENLLKIPS